MNKSILVLDSTQLDAFLCCQEYWNLNHQQRLEPISAEPKTAMSVGTYGHKLLELYYKQLAQGASLNQATDFAFAYDINSFCKCGHGYEQHQEAEGVNELGEDFVNTSCTHTACNCTEYNPQPFPLDAINLAAVRQRFREYTYTYCNNDFRLITPESAEIGFSVPLLDTSDKLYVLEGRIDLLAHYSGTEVWADHKFQMRKRNLYKKSIQFRNYAMVTGKLLGVINYVRMTKKVDCDTFQREVVSFNKPELDAWKSYLITVYDQIAECQKSDSYFKSRASCPGRFGYECQYTPICDEIIPQVADAKKATLYTVREPWIPW